MKLNEIVHMVWEIYDGPRTGISDVHGKPHYFNCIFDKSRCEYSENYEVYQIDPGFLAQAKEQWAIYRAWEAKHHGGQVSTDTHPGHGGLNQRYDELEIEIKNAIPNLKKVGVYNTVFIAADEQPDLPFGCLPNMEAQWTKIT
jgi:hypothetical protein